MELQCKERVDLLQALKKSRDETADETKAATPTDGPSRLRKDSPATTPKPNVDRPTWLGGDTVPQATYSDIPRPSPPISRPPPQPPRPSYLGKTKSGEDSPRANSLQNNSSSNLVPPGEQPRRGSRTPSPEKRGGMLRTLRKEGKERKGSSSGKMATTLRGKAPTAAASAASQVWPGQRPSAGSAEQTQAAPNGTGSSGTTWDPYTRSLVETPPVRRSVDLPERRASDNLFARPPSPRGYLKARHSNTSLEESHRSRPTRPPLPYPDYPAHGNAPGKEAFSRSDESFEKGKQPPPPPPHQSPLPTRAQPDIEKKASAPRTMAQAGLAQPMTYMREFLITHPLNPECHQRLRYTKLRT